jgi:general secretion pathway protein H
MPTSARGTRDSQRRTARGFTLIEVAVVMLVFVILLGMAGLRLTHDNSDLLRDEASRLVVALQGAQQQAILEGKLYALAVEAQGYRFFSHDQGKLAPLTGDESFRPHRLPLEMTLMLDERADRLAFTEKKRPDLVMFQPTGEFEPFTLVLQIRDVYWFVQGNSDGQITSSGQRASS